MSNRPASTSAEPTAAARIAHPRSQISTTIPLLPRRARRGAGLVALALLGGACGSGTLPLNPDGATSTCSDIQQAYANALLTAQECTVGASNQCGIQVRASFWCNCTTWVNGGADTLTAIANQYQAAGCLNRCNGVCAQPQSLSCQADTTSPTGGRCKEPMLVNLGVENDGGTFSVPVGYEIDINLWGAPNGYEMSVMLSSDAATVLEIAIPAGPVNPGGPPYLYRLKAVSAGQVVVQIPHVTLPGDDASQPAYTITLDIS